MPVPVACPSCKTRLNAPDSAIGKAVRCPRCSTAVKVAAPAPAAAKAPAPAKAPAAPRPAEEQLDELPAVEKPGRAKPARAAVKTRPAEPEEQLDELEEQESKRGVKKEKPGKKFRRDEPDEDEEEEDEEPEEPRKRGKAKAKKESRFEEDELDIEELRKRGKALSVKLSDSDRAQVQSQLSPKELILWVGKPAFGVRFLQHPLYFFIPLAVSVGLAAWAALSLTTGKGAEFVVGPGFLAAFTTFIALMTLFNDWRFCKRRIYVLTSDRAFIVSRGWFWNWVDSYNPEQVRNMYIWPLSLISGLKGDVIFRSVTVVRHSRKGGTSSSTTYYGFLAIRNVREVEQLIREVLLAGEGSAREVSFFYRVVFPMMGLMFAGLVAGGVMLFVVFGGGSGKMEGWFKSLEQRIHNGGQPGLPEKNLPPGIDKDLYDIERGQPHLRPAVERLGQEKKPDAARRAEVAQALAGVVNNKWNDGGPQAVKALKVWGTPEVEPTLENAMNGAFTPEETRVDAIHALGNIGDERAISLIASRLTASPPQREAAVEALGKLGAKTEPVVRPYLLNENADARDAALRALKAAKVATEAHEIQYTVAGLADRDEGRRAAVARKLAEMKPTASAREQVVAALNPVYKSHRAEVLLAGLQALVAWGDKKDFGPVIIDNLSNKDEAVRAFALKVAIEQKDPEAARFIADGLTSGKAADRDGVYRALAANKALTEEYEVLYAIGGLAESVGKSDRQVEAAHKLAGRKPIPALKERAVLALKAVSSSPRPEVRLAGLQALVVWGDKKDFGPVIIDNLSNKDEAVRAFALKVAIEQKDPEAARVITDGLTSGKAADRDGVYRALAANKALTEEYEVLYALGALADRFGKGEKQVEAAQKLAAMKPVAALKERVVPALKGVSASPKAETRLAGLQALVVWADKADVTPALVANVGRADEPIKVLVRKTLVEQKDPAALAPLAKKLNSRDIREREQAGEILRAWGPPAEAEVLNSINDRNGRVEALKILEVIGTKASVEPLQAALKKEKKKDQKDLLQKALDAVMKR